MAAADLTKQAIVKGTKELVEQMPFERISVTEIAKRCGINRNTFYYYFRDKYDVMDLIFQTDILPHLLPLMNQDDWPKSVVMLCRCMQKNKNFYSNALADLNPRALRQILVNHYRYWLMEIAKESYERTDIQGEEREFVARFYAHGIIGMVCDWVDAGMKKDPETATRVIHLSAKEHFFAK